MSVKRTLCCGSFNFFISVLDRSAAALSAWIAKVLLQIWLPFLMTKSVGCDRIKRGLPRAFTVSTVPPASIRMEILLSSWLRLSFHTGSRSLIVLSAETAMMQSPFFDKQISLVNTNVVGCVANTFACPWAIMTISRSAGGKLLKNLYRIDFSVTV